MLFFIPMIRILSIIFALLIATPLSVADQGDKLPGFGEGNSVSLNQEYFLGRAWLMSFRRQAVNSRVAEPCFFETNVARYRSMRNAA